MNRRECAFRLSVSPVSPAVPATALIVLALSALGKSEGRVPLCPVVATTWSLRNSTLLSNAKSDEAGRSAKAIELSRTANGCRQFRSHA